MKVGELIRELKKYPRDSWVGVAMHDNYEGEVAGCVSSVIEYEPNAKRDPEIEPTKGKGVVLRC